MKISWKVIMKKQWRIFLFKVDAQYLEKSHQLHNDFPFLSERMKLKKVKKLVANLRDKAEYVIHIRNLKEALNHG